MVRCVQNMKSCLGSLQRFDLMPASFTDCADEQLCLKPPCLLPGPSVVTESNITAYLVIDSFQVITPTNVDDSSHAHVSLRCQTQSLYRPLQN